MHRISNAGDDHFGFKKVIRKYIQNFANQAHTVLGYVVEPSDERADVSGSCLCSKKSLERGEYQGYICLHPFLRQCFDRPEAHGGHRDFHDDVLVYCGKLARLPQHTIQVAADAFGAHGPLYDLTYLADMSLEGVP